jgi:hypothetical protein
MKTLGQKMISSLPATFYSTTLETNGEVFKYYEIRVFLFVQNSENLFSSTFSGQKMLENKISKSINKP